LLLIHLSLSSSFIDSTELSVLRLSALDGFNVGSGSPSGSDFFLSVGDENVGGGVASVAEITDKEGTLLFSQAKGLILGVVWSRLSSWFFSSIERRFSSSLSRHPAYGHI